MKYVNLGNTGLKVSQLCLGCMSFGSPKWMDWVVEEPESMLILKKAWDLGINFFDTADVYSNGESEAILGRFIKQFNIPREEIVISTKVFSPIDKSGNQQLVFANGKDKKPNTHGLSRKHILHAVEDSLKRLGTEYIDLYIIHRWDDSTPIEETMDTLHELVQSGKVLHIGASSMHAHQFVKAQHYADKRGLTKFISMQNLYNLLYREEERDMIPFCLDQKVAITPYSPLAKGILARAHEFAAVEKVEDSVNSKRAVSDSFQKQFSERLTEGDRETLRAVSEIATNKNVTPAQIALAWLLTRPGVVSPVVGATKLANVESLVAALDVQLSSEEIDQLEKSYMAKEVYAVGMKK